MASIYTAALMEHNAHPDYKYQMDEPTCTHDGVNPSCGDELTLSLRLRGDRIEEAAFTGHGCAEMCIRDRPCCEGASSCSARASAASRTSRRRRR